MTENKRFVMIYFETDGNLIFDDKTGEQEWFDSTECMQDKEIVEMLNALHEENIMLKQKIDRQLHRNKRYSRQNEEVMGFLHDNYYSIWEEVLKECYHD